MSAKIARKYMSDFQMGVLGMTRKEKNAFNSRPIWADNKSIITANTTEIDSNAKSDLKLELKHV